MRKFIMLGLLVGSVVASRAATAQAGISLGAAVGFEEERHGLAFLRLGLPLLPYGARAEFLLYDPPGRTDTAIIGSAVLSLNAPLIQPYVLLGVGRYGMRSSDANGVSFGAGVRIGARRGLFIEGRRHDPIDRNLYSLGVAF